MNEVLKNEIDVIVNNDVSVEFENNSALLVNNNIDANLSEPEYVVEVSRKEYNVVGDELYIPRRFEDSPTWMQNLITQVVDTSISAKIDDINEISMSLESMIDAMEVAKNTYEMSVISSNDIDERINTAVTTLNSNMQDADSTILEVAQTRTTPEEASAITIDVISAQLGSTTAGTIGATVSDLQIAIANEEEARSTSIEILTSSIEGAFDANATAMNYLKTYVGVTETGEKSGTGLLADVEILQKQNDGVIETTTGTYDVIINPENPNLAQLVTTSEPYATWRALDTTGISNRLAHIGDVYVKYSDTANGAKEYIASYKFIRTIVDETSPYATDSEGFTWALIIDQAAQDAYEQALNAYDLADNKRRVFVTTPSGPYDIGDLWTKAVTGGSMLYKSTATRASGYNSGDWVVADDAGLNVFVSDVYTPGVTSLQNQIDGKIENWFTLSANDPKVSWVDADTKLKHNGDLWYQTDTKISYYYTSSTHTWNILDDDKAIQALANAATAQTAANNAQTSANTANSLLADIASDSKFTPSEKSLVKNEWDSIQSEYTKNLAQGTSYSVSTAAYTTAYNALNTYITPLLDSLTTTSDIVGTTFRATFKSYYDANVDLLNAVSNKINLIADGKITSYYMATFSAVQAMSTAWTASEKASNIGDLAVVYNDTTVDNNGTWRWDGANWVTTRDKKLVALASQVTALSTDLKSGDGTWADADSTLTNSLTTTINDKTAAVESKFAYNSIIGINGIYRKSGFGLTTNYVSGSGTKVDPYVSEFWIDASRLKFTNSNVTGQVAPFTIDATGVTPQITFNGKVAFTNVTGYTPTDTSSSNMIKNSEFETGVSPWALGWNPNGSTIVSFGLSENIHNADWIITGSTGSLTLRQTGRNTSTAYDDIGIDIYPQGALDYTKGYAVEAGKTYEFSVYVAAHRCKAKIGMYFFNSSGVEVGCSEIDYVTPLSGGKTIDGYTRMHVRATAPTGSATALLFVRKKNTDAGQTDSWMWIARPFFGKVDTNSVAPIDYIASDGSLANNNTLAQKLGYLSYADMADAATNGKTIINGGYLRGELIEANSIKANQINTTGLIAENISSNTISGKTIIGGTISGGTISGNTISGNTISGGTVTGTSIIGGSISGTTGTFSGEMTVGKFGDANMTISNGIAYIPIIDFGSIELSTIGFSSGLREYAETTGPLLRSTCSFQIIGVASLNDSEDIFVSYSVNNGGTWVQFASLFGSYGIDSRTVAFSASGVRAVANSRIRIRIDSRLGSFHGSIVVSNFS